MLVDIRLHFTETELTGWFLIADFRVKMRNQTGRFLHILLRADMERTVRRAVWLHRGGAVIGKELHGNTGIQAVLLALVNEITRQFMLHVEPVSARQWPMSFGEIPCGFFLRVRNPVRRPDPYRVGRFGMAED